MHLYTFHMGWKKREEKDEEIEKETEKKEEEQEESKRCRESRLEWKDEK